MILELSDRGSALRKESGGSHGNKGSKKTDFAWDLQRKPRDSRRETCSPIAELDEIIVTWIGAINVCRTIVHVSVLRLARERGSIGAKIKRLKE